MNCANHPEVAATAFCRECGKPMCPECQQPALGSVYCAEHLPVQAAPPPPPPPRVETPAFAGSPYSGPSASPYTAPLPPSYVVDPGAHPLLALLLGFIPGVGAIYNGQYAKGLVHAIVFGLLVSITGSGTAGDLEPLFGILIGVWVMYMALEAYHTARKRRAGEPVDEFSSILDVHGRRGGFPIGAITLIVLGVVLLLSTMDIIQLHKLLPYWPVLLILTGAYMLYVRVTDGAHPIARQEAHHER